MGIELNSEEAEILIAALTFAEGVALAQSPAVAEALKVLRPFRSRLLLAFMHEFSDKQPDIQIKKQAVP